MTLRVDSSRFRRCSAADFTSNSRIMEEKRENKSVTVNVENIRRNSGNKMQVTHKKEIT